jgi:hypothetical protein
MFLQRSFLTRNGKMLFSLGDRPSKPTTPDASQSHIQHDRRQRQAITLMAVAFMAEGRSPSISALYMLNKS